MRSLYAVALLLGIFAEVSFSEELLPAAIPKTNLRYSSKTHFTSKYNDITSHDEKFGSFGIKYNAPSNTFLTYGALVELGGFEIDKSGFNRISLVNGFKFHLWRFAFSGEVIYGINSINLSTQYKQDENRLNDLVLNDVKEAAPDLQKAFLHNVSPLMGLHGGGELTAALTLNKWLDFTVSANIIRQVGWAKYKLYSYSDNFSEKEEKFLVKKIPTTTKAVMIGFATSFF